MAKRLILLTEDAFEQLKRTHRKIDSITGPGVTNAPDSVSISPVAAQRVETSERNQSESNRPMFFPVTVATDGGADGTGTTPASYTYTVTSMGGVDLGTAVTVVRPRPNGKMTAGSSYGQAFYDGAVLKLWDAGEIETTDECA